MKSSLSNLVSRLLLTGALSLAVLPVLADQTWKGTSDNQWSNTGNWSGAAVPGSTDLVIYNATSTGNLSNWLASAYSVKGILFTNPAGPVSVNSASTFTSGASGINMTNATQPLTFNTAVALGASQIWVVGTNESLSFNGAVSGGYGLYKDGVGTLVLSGTNTFTGNFTNNGGPVWINNSGALGSGSKTIFVANNAYGAGLHLNGTNGNISLSSSLGYTLSQQYGAVINEAGDNVLGGPISVFSGGGYAYILANSGSLTLNGAITLGTTSRAIALGGAGNGTNNGGITGSNFPFRKQDAGTWYFTGNNPYTGYTTVEGGTLVLGPNGKIGGTTNITVFAGATLDVSAVTNSAGSNALFQAANQVLAGSGTVRGSVNAGAAGTLVEPGSLNIAQTAGGLGVVGTLTISSNLTMGATTTNYFDLNTSPAAGSGINDLVSVGGNLDPQNGRLFVTALTALTNGSTYTLFTYGGSKPSSFNSTVLTDTRYSFTESEATAGQINVTVGGAVNLIWTGTGSSSAWDANSTANWNSDTLTFMTADAVTFDDTATTNTATITGTLKPGSITVNATGNYLFQGSGNITGATGLTKDGTGTLVNSNTASTYTGPVTINAGMLTVSSVALNGSASTLGAGSNIVLNGGTFEFGGARPAASTFNRFWTLGTNGGTILSTNGTFFIPNVISGPGSLTKTGSVQIILGDIVTGALTNANNTYAGNTYVSQGELQIRNARGLGYGKAIVATGADLAVGGGASYGTVTNEIDLNGGDGSGSAGTLQVNDGGTSVTFGGPVSLLADSSVGTINNGNTVTFTIAGPVSGSGALKKLGTNTVSLTSAGNTYNGNTVISSGTLVLGGSATVSNSAGVFIAPGATFDVSANAAYNIGTTTTLNANGTGTTIATGAALIKGSSSGTVNLGSQAITLGYTPAAFTGDATHPALLITNNASLTLNNNTITISNAAATALGVGTYRVIQTGNGTAGTITGTPNATPVITGTGLAAGTAGTLSVSGGDVILTVQNTTTTALTISAGTNPSTYGNSLTFQATVSPTPANGETVTFKDGGTTLGTGTTAAGVAMYSTGALTAGLHGITAVYSGDSSDVASTSATLTEVVNQATLTVTANGTNRTYTGAAFSGGNGVGYSGFVNSDTSTVLGGTLTYGGTAQGAVGAGSYSIVPSGLTAANYSLNYVNGTLTINTVGVTVTANGQTKVYGTSDPALTYGYSPALIGSDSFSGSLTRVAGENVGTHAISQGTLALSTNYSLTFVGTNLTITAASLTVTASNTNKVYGQTVTFAGTEFTTAGLTNGDSVSSVTLTSGGATNNAGAGSYPIVPSAASGSGLANYSISYANGSLTVNPAGLGVTADNQSRAYGATNPVFTVTYSGFVNGDSLTNSDVVGTPVLAASADTNSTAGAYVITNTIGSLASTNYTFNLTNGVLTVGAATLTITADNTNKVYGQTLVYAGTEFTASGLQNGDTVGSVTLTSGGTAMTDATGAYPVTPSAATGGTFNPANYSITYDPGTLTVGTLAVTVTANGQAKVYGTSDPALTYGYSPALVGSDSFAGGLTRTAGENVGSYAIGQGTLALSTNYSLTFSGTNLAITAASLTVTANDASKAYGQTVTFAGTEFTTTGLTNGDTVTGVTLVSSGATNTATAGTYPIVASGATGSGLGNYTISYANGTLTVASPTPVSINSPVVLLDGTVQLTFMGGDAGASYRILGNTDLTSTNWSMLGTSLATTNGLPGFIDTDATNHAARYYRTVTP